MELSTEKNRNTQNEQKIFQSEFEQKIKEKQIQHHQLKKCEKSLETQKPEKIVLQKLPRKKVEIVAISDNHGDYKMMNQVLKLKGDIFIHAGDFTQYCSDRDLQKFFHFLDQIKQRFKHSIVIAGNHENVLSKLKLKTSNTKMTRQTLIDQLKQRCIYLEHQSIELQGIKIFGSPYTPQYCKKPNGRAFQYQTHHQKAIWDQVPNDTQLLITHGPPYGILDNGKGGKRAGSQYLKDIVKQINPRFHIFGHIHQGKGMNKIQDTLFLNVCNNPTRVVF